MVVDAGRQIAVALGWRVMKFHEMSKGDEKPRKPSLPKRRPDAAFDLWLERGLHQMFDSIAREPVPDELLKLIEDDRAGTDTKKQG